MSWSRRLLNLFRAEKLSQDIDREMAFHIGEKADELEAGGMTRSAAEIEARRRFGHRGTVRERTRDMDVLGWLESLAADVRYALRALRANPGFTTVAVLSLGLGIGANTAIFSLVNAVILRALPVERPEELVRVESTGGNGDFTNPIWEGLRDTPSMESYFAWGSAGFNLAQGGEVRSATGAWVSGSFFPAIGVRAVAGRLLEPADDRRGCAATAVLSEGFADARVRFPGRGGRKDPLPPGPPLPRPRRRRTSLLRNGRGSLRVDLYADLRDADRRQRAERARQAESLVPPDLRAPSFRGDTPGRAGTAGQCVARDLCRDDSAELVAARPGPIHEDGPDGEGRRGRVLGPAHELQRSAPGVARRGRHRAGDRVRQRGQPPARPLRRAPARGGGPPRHRCRSRPHRPPAPHREPDTRLCRRSRRAPVRQVGERAAGRLSLDQRTAWSSST